MGHRLSKIYTRTGDDGSTGLGNGDRVTKDSARVEAFGAVDELNSTIGIVLTTDIPNEISACLTGVQNDLLDLGGELSLPGTSTIRPESVKRLEEKLDKFNAGLPPLKEFILPGGGPAAATCHVARAVCRRAERRAWTLARDETVNSVSLEYLNRLSDLLFVIARVLTRHEQGLEQQWQRSSEQPDES